MTSRFLKMVGAAAVAVFAALPAAAQEPVKIAYIDPLSGGGASIGEVGLKTFQYLADLTNAHGGVIGRKLEIVAYDNKLNAQETLVQLQKAIDCRNPLRHPGQRLGIRRCDRGLCVEIQ